MSEPIDELIGVYRADGGPVGEAKYIIGKLLGTAHCALCDITHSPVRRKPAWDAMVARLGVPMSLLHLNEMPDYVAAAVAQHGSPLLLARRADALLVLLGPEVLDGSVDRWTGSSRRCATHLPGCRRNTDPARPSDRPRGMRPIRGVSLVVVAAPRGGHCTRTRGSGAPVPACRPTLRVRSPSAGATRLRIRRRVPPHRVHLPRRLCASQTRPARSPTPPATASSARTEHLLPTPNQPCLR